MEFVEYNIEITDNQITMDGELLETDELIWNKEIIQNKLENIDFNQDPNYCTNGKVFITSSNSW